jgi:hypothetical protein
MSGGSLPHCDLLYVRRHLPDAVKLAERYNAARADYINGTGTRERAEALRDQLAALDRKDPPPSFAGSHADR